VDIYSKHWKIQLFTRLIFLLNSPANLELALLVLRFAELFSRKIIACENAGSSSISSIHESGKHAARINQIILEREGAQVQPQSLPKGKDGRECALAAIMIRRAFCPLPEFCKLFQTDRGRGRLVRQFCAIDGKLFCAAPAPICASF